jgi:hypothetical protein
MIWRDSPYQAPEMGWFFEVSGQGCLLSRFEQERIAACLEKAVHFREPEGR